LWWIVLGQFSFAPWPGRWQALLNYAEGEMRRVCAVFLVMVACGDDGKKKDGLDFPAGTYDVTGELYSNTCPTTPPDSFATTWVVDRDGPEWLLSAAGGAHVEGSATGDDSVFFRDLSSNFDAASGCLTNEAVETEVFPAGKVFYAVMNDKVDVSCNDGSSGRCGVIYDIDGHLQD
jgi:hypothetical protein